VKQIETVESDNYAALGGPTFVRGLVRTYAKLLNADVGPILAALDRSELPPETGQVAADRKGIPFPAAARPVSPIFRYIVLSLGAIAGVILLLYFWHGEELLNGPGLYLPKSRQSAATPAAQPTLAAASSAVNLNPIVVDTPVAPAERIAAVPSAAPQLKVEKAADRPADSAAERPLSKPAPAPAMGSGSGRRIELSFDGNSWVEVKDAGGHILLSQLNLAGSQQTIEGRAPFDLVIGNAAHVQLRYRDAPVDLKPYTKAEVARLNLN
jgi:cytoskeleton protein RodZ